MVRFVEVLAVVLVAIAMALTLAHALELPGKLRLDKEQYFAVQTIYYPGFTIGGIAEILGILVLALLLYLTPFGGTRFLWTLSAFLLLVAVHAIYWVFTHPVNNFWLRRRGALGTGLDLLFGLRAEDANPATGRACATSGNIRMWRVPRSPCSA